MRRRSGWPGEQDAEQVERLALEPVGARPDVDHRIDDGIFGIHAARTQAQALVVRDRQQVIGHGEARAVMRHARAAAIDAAAEAGGGGGVRLPLGGAVIEVVDAGDVDEDFELELGRVAQREAHFFQLLRLHFVAELVGQRRHAQRAGPAGALRCSRRARRSCRVMRAVVMFGDRCWCARFSSAAG